MSSVRNLFLLLFFSCLSLTSCSGRGRLILQQPNNLIQLSSTAKSAILAKLKTDKLPNTIRAMLDTDIKSGAGRDSFLQALTFKQPSFFRLEAFATGVNALVFIATSEGNQFKAIIPGDKKVLIGTPSPKSLASLIQLPLTPLEMVALISGKIFPEFLDTKNQTLAKTTDGSIFFTAVSSNKRELRVRFDNDSNLRILELSLSDDGSGALKAKCSYQVGELKLLNVSLPELEAKVEIKELKRNVEISSDSIFTVAQPESYLVERID